MFYLGLGEGRIADVGGIAEALLPFAEGRTQSHAAAGCLAVSVTPAAWGAARREMAVCEEDGLVACTWARIDNRRDLARALGDASGGLADDTPRLIIAAYRKWGDDTPRHLEGDFAFVIHDPRDRTIFAARDALGVRPLYWTQGKPGAPACCATSIPAVRRAGGLSQNVDPDWVARYLAGTSMSQKATAFEGIFKLAPGHSLRMSAQGTRISRYSDLAEAISEPAESDAALFERYRDLLGRAVGSRLAVHETHGIEISGGLDSSTVLALALRQREGGGAPLHGFGFVRHEQEGPAVIGVSQRLGLAHNHLLCAETDQIPPERVWAILGHPAEHGTAGHHWPIYRLARQLGVTGLLSGFGGDEGVTNYAPNFPREMIARGEFFTLWRALGTNPVMRSARFAKIMLRRGSGSFYSRRLHQGAGRRIAQLPLAPDVISRLAIGEAIRRDAAYDAPHPTVKAFSAHMLSRPFVSTRTESCSLLAANHAIEYAWPLLDRQLIACFYAASPKLYFGEGMGRAFHRQAVAGIVPDERRLAPGKYLGERVEPARSSAARTQDAEADGVPDWTNLQPMLQEFLDRARLDDLVRQLAAPMPQAMGARRSLAGIVQLNNWLASKP